MENILLNINEAVMILGLAVESFFDIRFKRIPLWVLYIVIALGLVTGSVYLIISDVSNVRYAAVSRLIAIGVGLLLLILSRLSREAIGYGDSLVFMCIGALMGIDTLLGVMLMSISLAGVAGLIFLFIFKKNRKYQISFIPFIFVSYILLRLINI